MFFAVYRVNWFRASARFQRWNEEVILLKHEMKWTMNYFQKQQERWELQRQNVGSGDLKKGGLQAYAAKQASMWGSLASQAREIFATCHTVHN
jgi:hypothetical protein